MKKPTRNDLDWSFEEAAFWRRMTRGLSIRDPLCAMYFAKAREAEATMSLASFNIWAFGSRIEEFK